MTRQGRILPLRCGERELRVFSHAARGTSHPPAQRYGVAAARRLQSLQAARYFLGVLSTVESGNAEITFALSAKTRARRDNYV